MIPACFSQPNTISSSSQVPQNLITCIYQTQLCNSPTYLTLTWSKTLFSHSLTIHAPDSFSITISLNPSSFSFFRTKPGSKSIHLSHHHYQRIKLYWDFTRGNFTHNSAEPESGFYIAISCNAKLQFVLGDFWMSCSAIRVSWDSPTWPTYATVKEGTYGETSLIIKRLAWKFRGNERIFVGGVEFEFYWDVFNWVNNHKGTTNGTGHGVFVFQVGDGGVWPEMVGPEKRLMRKSLSLSAASASMPSVVSLSPSPSCSSVLQWAEESSDGGRSSCSSSTRSCGSTGGFSLLLYAWRRD
ncbi:hypothetical protein M0R45_028183 [Rubus argutus]|uniref:Uncharacterized protein n=1 Tax=Rubus argutus TaxID=59490 RepID=A0AAW1W3W2_RUBAR